MSTAPRLRFAPSPTGSLHLGNARTALINWLVARGSGGRLVLRIEDTDRERNQAGSEETILRDLDWMGLDWDEGPDVGGDFGPYRQSERSRRYAEVASRLVETGHAYPCFCDPDEVAELRRDQGDGRGDGQEAWRYPGTCRALSGEAAAEHQAAGRTPVLRLRVPEIPVRFVDLLRGETGVAAAELDDFVIVRSDGRPTYQFAVVVDDHDMRISDVVRGQDHLSNTPKQLLLYAALGWEAPRFAHLPLVLGEDRARLSKRHGASSVAAVRADGILPEALVNYLALLGWAPPNDQEVLDLEEIVALWKLSAISATNAVFDPDKLLWLNQQHLTRLPLERVARRAEPFLAAAGLELPAAGAQRDWWLEAIDLLRPAIARVRDLPERFAVFFRAVDADAEPVPELGAPEIQRALAAFADAGRGGRLGSAEAFRAVAKEIGATEGLRGRRLFHPLRVALTGEDHGPELARLVPLFELGASHGIEPAVRDVATRLQGVVAG